MNYVSTTSSTAIYSRIYKRIENKKAVESGVRAWAYRLTLGNYWMLKPEGELPVELP